MEDAARRLRYEALETYRKKVGAQGIFVAHHEDDQAETILMNLVRGTGTRGLRGMLPVNGYIARPFLAATRKDMETYCKEEGLSYRTDSTNGNPALCATGSAWSFCLFLQLKIPVSRQPSCRRLL